MGDSTNKMSGSSTLRSSARLNNQQSPSPDLNKVAIMLTELSGKVDDILNEKKKANERLDQLVEKNTEVLRRLDQHTEQIDTLHTKNEKLTQEVAVLKEKMMLQDQYSRKDILIVTGLEYSEEESNEELAQMVTKLLNTITGNTLQLTTRDFIAIHRNGRSYKNSRPPTITVKFIRFTDKDCVLSKRAQSNCKRMYPTIRMHHGLCPGYVEIRNKLSEVSGVKFARYAGANRFFTVCATVNGEDKFYNRIQNVQQLMNEMS